MASFIQSSVSVSKAWVLIAEKHIVILFPFGANPAYPAVAKSTGNSTYIPTQV